VFGEGVWVQGETGLEGTSIGNSREDLARRKNYGPNEPKVQSKLIFVPSFTVFVSRL